MIVKQGEVFFVTEALSVLEGIERGPAGNTSLTAAFALAQEMDEDQTIVVQETEYTGAGKHPMPQISFAKQNGIEVLFGDPDEEIPGKNIVFPDEPSKIKIRDFDLNKAKASYIKNAINNYGKTEISRNDFDFLIKDAKSDEEFALSVLTELGVKIS
ncbi:2-amino-4-ketopentanoate thiolase beta subunit [bioreactor metagenome]|uniref:2-amino-4-ketopentanoate thiolase beta subunit n=1 Tax=bioreactor metagenome TaxID=1076179 RepID=A0A645J4R7_9ZZZZ